MGKAKKQPAGTGLVVAPAPGPAATAAVVSAAAAPGAKAADRCDNGLGELRDQPILVPAGGSVELRLDMCGSPADLLVTMDSVVVYHQHVVDTFVGHIPAPANGASSLLLWSVLPTASTWRAQTELSANGAVGFRMRKSSGSKWPLAKFVAIVRAL